MKNYVQYHNTDKNGGRPSFDAGRFAIYANKSIRHLQGQRVWLISGESSAKKKVNGQTLTKSYFLESSFIVDTIEEGSPNVASGREGIRFDPALALSGMPWFDDFKRSQQNFSLGVREIDADTIDKLDELARRITEHGTATPEEMAAALEIDKDPQCQGLSKTERSALVQARIGQGNYRRLMKGVWGDKCAVTGCAIETVLIASHAKPWKSSSNQERLDPYNGLLLAASVDRLFDKGLITFEDDGGIVVSKNLSDAELKLIGLSRMSRLAYVDKRHLPYLKVHREEVFSQK
jgi:hypothetical protein